jgi:flagellin
MSIIGRSNQAALIALGGLHKATDLYTKATRRLATGLRIESPSDDPGGFAFSTRMRAQAKSLEKISIYNQASRSMVQTASDGISTIIEHLQTIRTLAVSSANSTLTTADRQANQTQLASLRNEINSIANNTTFNGKSLLNGTYASGKATLSFQVGVDTGNTISLNVRTMTATALGIGSTDVSTPSGANSALTAVDAAIATATTAAANTGSVENRLDMAGMFVSQQWENYEKAIGGVEDADLARETVNFAIASILRQTSAAALAQANAYPQNILSAILPGS